MKFEPGDIVIHNTNNKRGIVTEVNRFYGWYRVKWFNGPNKFYSFTPQSYQMMHIEDQREHSN